MRCGGHRRNREVRHESAQRRGSRIRAADHPACARQPPRQHHPCCERARSSALVFAAQAQATPGAAHTGRVVHRHGRRCSRGRLSMPASARVGAGKFRTSVSVRFLVCSSAKPANFIHRSALSAEIPSFPKRGSHSPCLTLRRAARLVVALAVPPLDPAVHLLRLADEHTELVETTHAGWAEEKTAAFGNVAAMPSPLHMGPSQSPRLARRRMRARETERVPELAALVERARRRRPRSELRRRVRSCGSCCPACARCCSRTHRAHLPKTRAA